MTPSRPAATRLSTSPSVPTPSCRRFATCCETTFRPSTRTAWHSPSRTNRLSREPTNVLARDRCRRPLPRRTDEELHSVPWRRFRVASTHLSDVVRRRLRCIVRLLQCLLEELLDARRRERQHHPHRLRARVVKEVPGPDRDVHEIPWPTHDLLAIEVKGAVPFEHVE